MQNLKQIGLSFRTWSLDNADRFPMQVSVTNGGTLELISSRAVFVLFEVMSNELSTPRVLFCPTDTKRTFASTFGKGMSDVNISYFVNPDASTNSPDAFLAGDDNLTVNGVLLSRGLAEIATNSAMGWTESRHEKQGNVGLVDGSVQQFTRKGLTEALGANGSLTLRLLMP